MEPDLRGKKILLVIGGMELGGAERQALLLSRVLKDEYGAKVAVWGFGHGGRAAEICDEDGVPWRVLEYPLSFNRFERWKKLIGVANEIRKERPHAIVSYTHMANIICGVIWKWTGAKSYAWNQQDEGLIQLNNRLEKMALSRTPKFIAVSSGCLGHLVEYHKIDPGICRVIPAGVQLSKPEKNRRQWREELAASDGSYLICMLANLSVHKDHETLLRAFKIVVQKAERPVSLLLAGRFDGNYEYLKTLVGSLSLESSVRFLGKVSDISGLLGACDLGVFSSRSEGCPNGVLECMAKGLPVVATDIEGVRDVIDEMQSRFLAPVGNYEVFADRILEFISSESLSHAVGKSNRARIETYYSPLKMARDTVNWLFDVPIRRRAGS